MTIEFYILDLETTGTSCGYHDVVEISIIKANTRQQLSKDIIAEYPERANQTALNITQKTKQSIKLGHPKEDVVKACNEFFEADGLTPEARCIVGHNIVNFDKKFVHDLWEKCNSKFPANFWLDTIKYLKQYMIKNGVVSRKTNLEAALHIVGAKPRYPLHSAKMDTQNNWILWKKLVDSGVDYLDLMERHEHIIQEEDSSYDEY